MDDFEKYLNKAFHFLSFRPHSEKEVRDSLIKKKALPEIIDRIITQLKEHNFLNDEDFARWFIESRLRFRPKSLRIIKLELKQKGVDRETIETAISNFTHSPSSGQELQVSNNTNELDLESAKKLVEKKIDKYRDVKRQEVYQKLGGFLARRGFDWDTIKKSIDSVLSKGV